MADHYPKQRHRPAPPAPVADSKELLPDDLDYVAAQKDLFRELFGREGVEFFSFLYADGLIEGWRSVRDVHSLTPPPISEDDREYQFQEFDFQR